MKILKVAFCVSIFCKILVETVILFDLNEYETGMGPPILTTDGGAERVGQQENFVDRNGDVASDEVTLQSNHNKAIYIGDNPEPNTRPGCSLFDRGYMHSEARLKHECISQKYYVRCDYFTWCDIDECLQNNWSWQECWSVKRPVKLIVHGYNPENKHNDSSDDLRIFLSYKLGKLLELADELRDLDYNVIIVDWLSVANQKLIEENHSTAYRTILDVSKCLEIFLKEIVYEPTYNENAADRPEPKDIHIIGYSVGAHVASIVTNNDLNNEKSIYYGKLTAIDPEGGVFAKCRFRKGKDTKVIAKRGHIKMGCAFVEIYQCNAGCREVPGSDHSGASNINYQGRYGSPIQNGHVNIIVNDGMRQPGCDDLSDEDINCSQNACLKIYMANLKRNAYACRHTSGSILSGTFTSDCRNGTLKLGMDIDETASGSFQYIYSPTCSIEDEECQLRAENGECVTNPTYMLHYCQGSCASCNCKLYSP